MMVMMMMIIIIIIIIIIDATDLIQIYLMQNTGHRKDRGRVHTPTQTRT